MTPKNTKNKINWFFKTLFFLTLLSTIFITFLGGGVYWYFSKDLPEIITTADYHPLGVTQIVLVGGEKEVIIGELFKEKRYLIPFNKIPEKVIKAFISAEDDQFFQHQGINLASILRAAIANFKAGHVVQGGSTITQQVVKSLLLTSEKKFDRKIKEMILAARLEGNLTKEQILYLYLNQIYLGHGAYGIQAASRVYYNKDISELGLGEMALLAGLLQAPGKYSPILNPKRAKERQNYVLRRMYENKFISQAEMLEASALPLRVFIDQDVNFKIAPHWVEYLRRYLLEKYGEKTTYEEGLRVLIPSRVETCLSSQKALREGLRALDKRVGWRGPLKTYKALPEIEKALREQRVQMIEKKLGFRVLLPDGHMDSVEALKIQGLKSDRELLEKDEIYQAVVTSTEDSGNKIGVMMGAIKAELSPDWKSWAKKAILKRGDLLWVRVQTISEHKILVSLEQEPQAQGALFSLEAKTGYVVAMEGGYDFEQSEFNRATQALRQPGSAFKPVIYSAALEKGFTPTTVIVDSPIVYNNEEAGKWKPDNFEEKFYGDTLFRQALIKSRNVPTIKIVQSITVPFLIEFAKRIGFNSQFPLDLSISLGSVGVSLVDLTRVYAIFPRLGRKLTPLFFSKILDQNGKILEESKPSVLPTEIKIPSPVASPSVLPTYPPLDDQDQVMDPRFAYVMTHLMNEVIEFGTGHQAKMLGRIAAGKTGTTSEFVDAWFMGFTPDIVTGTWVGFDSQKTLGHQETGAKAALPIWLSFMKEAVKNYHDSDFTIPPGVVFATINPTTGKRVPPDSINATKEAFVEGAEPKEEDSQNGVSPQSQSKFFKEDMD